MQRVQILSLEPASYQFTLSAMSAEKLNFQLPASFTIGPRDDNTTLVKYARFVSSQDHDTLTRLVQGIIEGETRVLAAGMSIEDIFRSRNDLKKTIVEHITEEVRGHPWQPSLLPQPADRSGRRRRLLRR